MVMLHFTGTGTGTSYFISIPQYRHSELSFFTSLLAFGVAMNKCLNHSPFECDVNLGCVESPNNLLVLEKEKIVYA